MIIRYDIKPKSDDEYRDVIDSISDWLDRNNIDHTRFEFETCQMGLSKNYIKGLVHMLNPLKNIKRSFK